MLFPSTKHACTNRLCLTKFSSSHSPPREFTIHTEPEMLRPNWYVAKLVELLPITVRFDFTRLLILRSICLYRYVCVRHNEIHHSNFTPRNVPGTGDRDIDTPDHNDLTEKIC